MQSALFTQLIMPMAKVLPFMMEKIYIILLLLHYLVCCNLLLVLVRDLEAIDVMLLVI
jgi:hypothetical protein